jgi:hypothetical protein
MSVVSPVRVTLTVLPSGIVVGEATSKNVIPGQGEALDAT